MIAERAAAREIKPRDVEDGQPLGQDGGGGGPGDAPTEHQDEQGVQNHVGDGPAGQNDGRRPRPAFGHEQVIRRNRQHGEEPARQDDCQVLASVGRGVGRCSQQRRKLVQAQQAGCGDRQVYGSQNRQRRADHAGCLPGVAGAQGAGHDGHAAESGKETDGDGGNLRGESGGQAAQRVNSDDVADERAVNDAVQGHHDDSQHRGQRHLQQQEPHGRSAHGLGAEGSGSWFGHGR